MEKQPIDELFRTKLRDAEVTPDRSAWHTLQEKLGNKRIAPIWSYVSVAASALLMVSFGWWAISEKAAPDLYSKKALVPFGKTRILSKGTKVDSRIVETRKSELYSHSKSSSTVMKPASGSHDRVVAQEKRRVTSRELRTSIDSPLHATSGKRLQANALEESKPGENKALVEPQLARLAQSSNIAIVPVVSLDRNVVPVAERALIVSIDAPANNGPVTVEPSEQARNTGTGNKAGFGSFLNKVRKFKDGDVFASGLSKTKANRRGVEKLYDEVKESIQNNSFDQ